MAFSMNRVFKYQILETVRHVLVTVSVLIFSYLLWLAIHCWLPGGYRLGLDRLRAKLEHTPVEQWLLLECFEPGRFMPFFVMLAAAGFACAAASCLLKRWADHDDLQAYLSSLSPKEIAQRKQKWERIIELGLAARKQLLELKARIEHGSNPRLPPMETAERYLKWVEGVLRQPNLYLDSRSENTVSNFRLSFAHSNWEEGPYQEALFRLSDYLEECGRPEAVRIRKIYRRSGKRGVREYKKKRKT